MGKTEKKEAKPKPEENKDSGEKVDKKEETPKAEDKKAATAKADDNQKGKKKESFLGKEQTFSEFYHENPLLFWASIFTLIMAVMFFVTLHMLFKTMEQYNTNMESLGPSGRANLSLFLLARQIQNSTSDYRAVDHYVKTIEEYLSNSSYDESLVNYSDFYKIPHLIFSHSKTLSSDCDINDNIGKIAKLLRLNLELVNLDPERLKTCMPANLFTILAKCAGEKSVEKPAYANLAFLLENSSVECASSVIEGFEKQIEDPKYVEMAPKVVKFLVTNPKSWASFGEKRICPLLSESILHPEKWDEETRKGFCSFKAAVKCPQIDTEETKSICGGSEL